MQIIITGATGLIGKRLVKHWLDQQHEITVVSRTREHIEKTFGNAVRAVTWDALNSSDLQAANIIVNLAGASVGSKRWSESYKKEIVSSRVDSTKKIVSLLQQLPANRPRLLNASAIGIYGLQTQTANGLPPAMTENKEIEWGNPTDFLSLVGQEWEKAAEPAIKQGVKVVFMRFGVVLAQEGGALPKLVMPYKFFIGGVVGTGCQAFSWIAIDDLVRAIDFIVANEDISGPVNIVAPGCVRADDLSRAIATVLQRPRAVKLPAFFYELMLGKQMAQELLLEGQHVYPQRLVDMKFNFNYPDIESALKHIEKE